MDVVGFLQDKEARRTTDDSKQWASVPVIVPPVNPVEIGRYKATTQPTATDFLERPGGGSDDRSSYSGSHSGSPCGSPLLSSLKSSDSRMKRVGSPADSSGRSGAIVHFVDTVSDNNESKKADTHDGDNVAVEQIESECDIERRENMDEGNTTSKGEGNTVSKERRFSEKKPPSSRSACAARCKQRLMIDTYGRLYVPGWRKNNASEQRVFDAIDRAFSRSTPFGRESSRSSRHSCEKGESAKRNETTEVLKPRWRLQRSQSSCGHRHQVKDTKIPHRTPSLNTLSPIGRRAGHLSSDDRPCPDGAGSQRQAPYGSASSGFVNKDKLQRRISVCSRIPRPNRSGARQQNLIKPAAGGIVGEQLANQRWSNFIAIDKWDEYVSDMFNVYSCVF